MKIKSSPKVRMYLCDCGVSKYYKVKVKGLFGIWYSPSWGYAESSSFISLEEAEECYQHYLKRKKIKYTLIKQD